MEQILTHCLVLMMLLLWPPDDNSLVKLFRFPVDTGAQFREYEGHSSHVSNIRFSVNDTHIISIGGNDRTIFQWKVNNSGNEGKILELTSSARKPEQSPVKKRAVSPVPKPSFDDEEEEYTAKIVDEPNGKKSVRFSVAQGESLIRVYRNATDSWTLVLSDATTVSDINSALGARLWRASKTQELLTPVVELSPEQLAVQLNSQFIAEGHVFYVNFGEPLNAVKAHQESQTTVLHEPSSKEKLTNHEPVKEHHESVKEHHEPAKELHEMDLITLSSHIIQGTRSALNEDLNNLKTQIVDSILGALKAQSPVETEKPAQDQSKEEVNIPQTPLKVTTPAKAAPASAKSPPAKAPAKPGVTPAKTAPAKTTPVKSPATPAKTGSPKSPPAKKA